MSRPSPLALTLVLALGLAARPAAVAAAVAPLGARITVSACASCSKDFPSVAGSPSGRFFAAWSSIDPLNPSRRSVAARLFTSWGAPRTADLPLDRRAIQQYDAQIAATPQGTFVAVWSAIVGGESDVFAQRLSALGAPVGPVILVSKDDPRASAPPFDFNPAVATAADGGFAVAWMSLALPLPEVSPVLLARRFDAAGRPLGAPLQLSDTLVSGQRASICIDTAGRLVATWVSLDALLPFEPSHKGVVVRRAAANGQPLGRSIVVSAPANESASAAVACGPGSTFVVAWQADEAPGTTASDVFALQLTRAARAFAPPIRVDTAKAGEQKNPAVAFDRTGNFVVVWEGDAPGGGQRVSGRRFAFSGVPDGPEFAVASVGPGIPAHPALATIGTAGGFVVMWRAGVAGLAGQRFAP